MPTYEGKLTKARMQLARLKGLDDGRVRDGGCGGADEWSVGAESEGRQ